MRLAARIALLVTSIAVSLTCLGAPAMADPVEVPPLPGGFGPPVCC